MARLPREYYFTGAVELARGLLGKTLVRRLNGETLACRITETEAYVGRCDRACHAYGGRRTRRTEVMFGPPGHAYLYLIYGLHCCLNLVAEPEGEPSAVLIRGAEVLCGWETIRRLRFGVSDGELTAYQKKNVLNGPGKLCRALALTTAENGLDLTGDTLFLCDSPADIGLQPPPARKERVCSGPRIGVDYAQEARDFPWRFWLETEE